MSEKTDETTNLVLSQLTELGVTGDIAEKIITDLGAKTVEHLNGLTEQDLIEAGMQKLPARGVIKQLQKAVVEATSTPASSFNYDGILPVVPDNDSWLKALKAGGVLKISESTVISAVRAALAHRAGLYDVPRLLVEAMEQFADTNEQQVDPTFFALRKQLTRKSYGDLFEAIDGMDGTYVSDARKKQLFNRIDTYLWVSVDNFYYALKNWYETWANGATNPTVMLSLLSSQMGGGMGMPTGMMQPPDTGVLRDEAAAVADSINKVFAGTGVQIAAALAYEANQIKETLNDERLPQMIGAPNREQMLRQLKVAVPPTYPRLEQNLTQFVMAILKAQDQPAGEELKYFGSLYMLGSQIRFEELGSTRGRVTGIGGGKVTGVGGGNRI